MKKVVLLVLFLGVTLVLSGCETIPEDYSDLSSDLSEITTRYNELEEDYSSLLSRLENIENSLLETQDDYDEAISRISQLESNLSLLEDSHDELKLSLIDLEVSVEGIDFETIISKLSDIQNIDISQIDKITEIETSISNTLIALDDLDLDVSTILNYDLDSIETITETIDAINTSISTINSTLTLLSTGSGQDYNEILSSLEYEIQDINLKLISLLNYDIIDSNYALTNEEVKSLMFALAESYTFNLPIDAILPQSSNEPSTCIDLSYDVCYSDDNIPKLYSKNYEEILAGYDKILDYEKYITSFNDFISGFNNMIIPVFLDETDNYLDGKIHYIERTSIRSVYEMQYVADIDGEEVRVDAMFEVRYLDHNAWEVNLLIDIKSNVLGFYYTDKVMNFSFIFDHDVREEALLITIQETNYPSNTAVAFRNYADFSAITYYQFEEFVKNKTYFYAYNDVLGGLYSHEYIYNNGYKDAKDEYEVYSMTDGMIYWDDEIYSGYYVPARWFDNWQKISYREDGELTKIKISKILLDNGEELIISDETLSDSYTKIYLKDTNYYNTNQDLVELDNYLFVGVRSTSALNTNMPYTADYNTNMGSTDPDDYLIEISNRGFDIESYTYGETKDIPEKTAQDVYNDSLRILEIMEYYYSSSYARLDNLDEYILNFDEDYYDFDSSYVYYPQNYKQVYLYALYSGDYEFLGKNPNEYTKDDVTVNP